MLTSMGGKQPSQNPLFPPPLSPKDARFAARPTSFPTSPFSHVAKTRFISSDLASALALGTKEGPNTSKRGRVYSLE
ncbi:hypothetical protein BT69DRAFT_1116876 [Atractiella rhizophila]|nr:hypothetical protein BT69DRAFT_1116876 [Atractiella rhizophila]